MSTNARKIDRLNLLRNLEFYGQKTQCTTDVDTNKNTDSPLYTCIHCLFWCSCDCSWIDLQVNNTTTTTISQQNRPNRYISTKITKSSHLPCFPFPCGSQDQGQDKIQRSLYRYQMPRWSEHLYIYGAKTLHPITNLRLGIDVPLISLCFPFDHDRRKCARLSWFGCT